MLLVNKDFQKGIFVSFHSEYQIMMIKCHYKMQ